MKAAVLDLGSNTFNLVIAELNARGRFDVLYQCELPGKIGKGSYENQLISQEAMDRGMKVLDRLFKEIRRREPEIIKAFGTSALRGATNVDVFLDRIRQKFGIEVELISGEQEARWIYEGVKLSYPYDIGNFLIMDIGGGSCEFIIANHTIIHWQSSYDIGASRILERIKPSDPLSDDDIIAIEKIMQQEMSDLFRTAGSYLVKTLIGAAGSFTTFSSMLYPDYDQLRQLETCRKIDTESFYGLYLNVIHSPEEERLKMRGLPEMRVDTIPIAAVMVNYIIHSLQINTLLQSDYALKEGVIAELIKQQKTR